VRTLLLVVLVAAACEAAGAAAVPAKSDLRITVWPAGKDGQSYSWKLRCDPMGGSLPKRAAACQALAKAKEPFKPVPGVAICTAEYGGPAVALVEGRFRGKRLRTTFARRNGCEIARWDRMGALFPYSRPLPR